MPSDPAHTIEDTLHAAEEFERQPVPDRALKGAKSFWGMYAGEHTAGTEFMIVPPLLFMSGSLADSAMKNLLLAATLLWFIAWPLANREA